MFINYDLYRFSFGVNKEAKYLGSIHGQTNPIDRELTGWEKFSITILVFAFVILVLVAGYYAYVCYKKHNERQHANRVLYQHV